MLEWFSNVHVGQAHICVSSESESESDIVVECEWNCGPPEKRPKRNERGSKKRKLGQPRPGLLAGKRGLGNYASIDIIRYHECWQQFGVKY